MLEAGLPRIGFTGRDPANIAGSGVDARFNAAMPFFDGGFRDEFALGRGIEVVFNLGFQRWAIAFQRQHEIGFVPGDFGRDLHLTTHGVDGYKGAFELPGFGKAIQKFWDRCCFFQAR